MLGRQRPERKMTPEEVETIERKAKEHFYKVQKEKSEKFDLFVKEVIEISKKYGISSSEVIELRKCFDNAYRYFDAIPCISQPPTDSGLALYDEPVPEEY